MTFKDNFGNEYLDPYIPDKIVGFIGIDPDIVGGGSGGGGSGIDNHEQLTNLLGGDNTGHWHVNAEQYHCLTGIFSSGRMPAPPNSGSNYVAYYMLNDIDYCELIELFLALGINSSNPNTPSKPVQIALEQYIDARIAKYISDNNIGG